MGGRGAFYGNTNVMKYHEFRVIKRIGKIKIIKPIRQGSLKTPTLSHSKNAVYATVKKNGGPKQINVYDENRKKLYDSDFDHNHSKNSGYNEYHVQYYDKNGIRSMNYQPANREQRKMIKQFLGGI